MSNLLKGSGSVVSAVVFDARTEAQRILAQARQEAEALRERARAEGREEGRAEGRAEIAQTLVRLHTEAGHARTAAGEDLRRLAVRIASKILGHALELDPTLVVDICAQALRGATEQREIVVRVHPDDLPAIEQARPQLRAALLKARDFTLRPDAGVGRGGCIVETELGSVDARLETQLAVIENALCGDSK
ncbi:MAG TPA: FliH/SctL family protein [Polyangia bacterium]|nr:FliH/SctL family protein [Polyangia bacterium]